MIATDGVFSMDGYLAKLDTICELADKYGAMVMVDDSHATGFMGKTGRGTPEELRRARTASTSSPPRSARRSAARRAASRPGGGRSSICSASARGPYLFSNTLAPPIVGASIAVLDLLDRDDRAARPADRRTPRRFRERDDGGRASPSSRASTRSCPIMLGDARLAADIARAMLDEGIYVIGFSYPVVPKGEARIRVQLSAAHEPEHVERAIAAFTKVGRRFGVIG